MIYLLMLTALGLPQITRGIGEPVWVYGNISEAHNDAPSMVDCPVGYRAAECTCNDTSVCDGARFVEGRPESCIAYNKGGHGSPIQALAKCYPTIGGQILQLVLGSKHTGDFLQCPDGYVMESCAVVDWWSEYRRTYVTKASNGCGLKAVGDHLDKSMTISVLCIRTSQSNCYLYKCN